MDKTEMEEYRMEIETEIPDNPQEKTRQINERLENTREKMEIEARIFIEATKHFTLEWIRREMDLEELPLRIKDIVETNLNCDNYWIHRNPLPLAGISRDYLDFKKEKMRRELTSSIRMILGCASEIFGDLNEEESENKIWVVERGKRKYVCFLRFSDEMTASLNRYLEKLEEYLILNHEIKEEIEKMKGKKT